MRLERVPIDHVDRTVEQAGDKFFQAHIFVDGPFRPGLEFHQNIDVAVRVVVAVRYRTEHGRAADSARAQGGLGFLQSGNDIIAAHDNILPNSDTAFQQRRLPRSRNCGSTPTLSAVFASGSIALTFNAKRRLSC
jgi:hypothetical protein